MVTSSLSLLLLLTTLVVVCHSFGDAATFVVSRGTGLPQSLASRSQSTSRWISSIPIETASLAPSNDTDSNNKNEPRLPTTTTTTTSDINKPETTASPSLSPMQSALQTLLDEAVLVYHDLCISMDIPNNHKMELEWTKSQIQNLIQDVSQELHRYYDSKEEEEDVPTTTSRMEDSTATPSRTKLKVARELEAALMEPNNQEKVDALAAEFRQLQQSETSRVSNDDELKLKEFHAQLSKIKSQAPPKLSVTDLLKLNVASKPFAVKNGVKSFNPTTKKSPTKTRHTSYPKPIFENDIVPDTQLLQSLLDQAALLFVSGTSPEMTELAEALMEEIGHYLYYAVNSNENGNNNDENEQTTEQRTRQMIAEELQAALELFSQTGDAASKQAVDDLAAEYKLAQDGNNNNAAPVANNSRRLKVDDSQLETLKISAEHLVQSLQSRVQSLQQQQQQKASPPRPKTMPVIVEEDEDELTVPEAAIMEDQAIVEEEEEATAPLMAVEAVHVEDDVEEENTTMKEEKMTTEIPSEELVDQSTSTNLAEKQPVHVEDELELSFKATDDSVVEPIKDSFMTSNDSTSDVDLSSKASVVHATESIVSEKEDLLSAADDQHDESDSLPEATQLETPVSEVVETVESKPTIPDSDVAETVESKSAKARWSDAYNLKKAAAKLDLKQKKTDAASVLLDIMGLDADDTADEVTASASLDATTPAAPLLELDEQDDDDEATFLAPDLEIDEEYEDETIRLDSELASQQFELEQEEEGDDDDEATFATPNLQVDDDYLDEEPTLLATSTGSSAQLELKQEEIDDDEATFSTPNLEPDDEYLDGPTQLNLEEDEDDYDDELKEWLLESEEDETLAEIKHEVAESMLKTLEEKYIFDDEEEDGLPDLEYVGEEDTETDVTQPAAPFFAKSERSEQPLVGNTNVDGKFTLPPRPPRPPEMQPPVEVFDILQDLEDADAFATDQYVAAKKQMYERDEVNAAANARARSLKRNECRTTIVESVAGAFDAALKGAIGVSKIVANVTYAAVDITKNLLAARQHAISIDDSPSSHPTIDVANATTAEMGELLGTPKATRLYFANESETGKTSEYHLELDELVSSDAGIVQDEATARTTPPAESMETILDEIPETSDSKENRNPEIFDDIALSGSQPFFGLDKFEASKEPALDASSIASLPSTRLTTAEESLVVSKADRLESDNSQLDLANGTSMASHDIHSDLSFDDSLTKSLDLDDIVDEWATSVPLDGVSDLDSKEVTSSAEESVPLPEKKKASNDVTATQADELESRISADRDEFLKAAPSKDSMIEASDTFSTENKNIWKLVSASHDELPKAASSEDSMPEDSDAFSEEDKDIWKLVTNDHSVEIEVDHEAPSPKTVYAENETNMKHAASSDPLSESSDVSDGVPAEIGQISEPSLSFSQAVIDDGVAEETEPVIAENAKPIVTVFDKSPKETKQPVAPIPAIEDILVTAAGNDKTHEATVAVAATASVSGTTQELASKEDTADSADSAVESKVERQIAPKPSNAGYGLRHVVEKAGKSTAAASENKGSSLHHDSSASLNLTEALFFDSMVPSDGDWKPRSNAVLDSKTVANRLHESRHILADGRFAFLAGSLQKIIPKNTQSINPSPMLAVNLIEDERDQMLLSKAKYTESIKQKWRSFLSKVKMTFNPRSGLSLFEDESSNGVLPKTTLFYRSLSPFRRLDTTDSEQRAELSLLIGAALYPFLIKKLQPAAVVLAFVLPHLIFLHQNNKA